MEGAGTRNALSGGVKRIQSPLLSSASDRHSVSLCLSERFVAWFGCSGVALVQLDSYMANICNGYNPSYSAGCY